MADLYCLITTTQYLNKKYCIFQLEGESQCIITLHLLPVCDIIGQTHILHIHYFFVCVFTK